MATTFNMIDMMLKKSIENNNQESIEIFQQIKNRQLHTQYIEGLINNPATNIFEQIKYSQEIENCKNQLSRDYKKEIADKISLLRKDV